MQCLLLAGGRASTRRTPEHQFDHGLQFLRASTPEFKAVLASWLEEGECMPTQAFLQRFSKNQCCL